jgi:hypothetical protein
MADERVRGEWLGWFLMVSFGFRPRIILDLQYYISFLSHFSNFTVRRSQNNLEMGNLTNVLLLLTAGYCYRYNIEHTVDIVTPT